MAGAGVEYKVLDNVSFFAEYDYMAFIKEKNTITYSDSVADDFSFKQDLSHFVAGCQTASKRQQTPIMGFVSANDGLTVRAATHPVHWIKQPLPL